MEARIYIVKGTGKGDRLIKAVSAVQAIEFAVHPTIKVASRDELIEGLKANTAIEDATVKTK